jgi:precorrin-2 dehydrogenase/sirohydrochlorin ferrochelatase
MMGLMGDFPIMLKVAGRRCVVVGGGEVAARRMQSLLDAGAMVTIIAPAWTMAIAEAAAASPDRVTCMDKSYEAGDLQRRHNDAALVIVATDDPKVNQQVQADARQIGVLVNRADDPEAGDFTVPAHAHHGPVTIAVHSGGVSASAAATIRRQMSAHLDPDWPRLLEAAAPHRQAIQQAFADVTQRRERLKQLTDEQAMRILKTQGIDALKALYAKLLTSCDA